jgi:hypothetical protein
VRLRWEVPYDGLARGFGPGTHELAQVAHVYSPTGDDLGWVVWLTHEGGELFDHYASAELAMAAAEAALEAQP